MSFKELYKIDVSDKVEKKGKLSYLSWAWAWAEIKKRHEDFSSMVYEREDGRIYWDDGKTAWVKVGATVGGVEHIEYLPIMDFKNASIPLDNITSFHVNTSIQRATTKAISRHGLGLYIYAGEDLPESNKDELIRLIRGMYSAIDKKDADGLCDFFSDKKIDPKQIPSMNEDELQSLYDDLNNSFKD